MSVYFEFVKKSFQQRFAYRMNSFLLIFRAAISLFVMINVWSVLYQQHVSVKGISLSSMVTYVILSEFLVSLTGSSLILKLEDQISRGSVIVDYMKPVDFGLLQFADNLGENLYRTIFNTLPVCIMGAFLWGLQLPAPGQAVLFGVSVFNSVILSFYINYILSLLSFFSDGRSTNAINFLRGMKDLFSGTVVPLWFYPDLLYKICGYLPFRLMIFDPISIYLGRVTWTGALQVILFQIGWIILLFMVERFVWLKVQTRISVNGG